MGIELRLNPGVYETPVQMPGDERWREADAAEWLRRHGFERFYYRYEEFNHVFFEQFEYHWDHESYLEEMYLRALDVGVSLVYRKYPTIIKAAYARDRREVAGGERWVRCFKFFHDKKNYGRAKEGELSYRERKGPRKTARARDNNGGMR